MLKLASRRAGCTTPNRRRETRENAATPGQAALARGLHPSLFAPPASQGKALRAYFCTAPYFDLFRMSTAPTMSTTPSASDIHGLPEKPATT